MEISNFPADKTGSNGFNNGKQQIDKADRQIRKRMILLVVVEILLGLVLILWFYTYLETLLTIGAEAPETAMNKVLNLLGIVLTIVAISLIGFSFYILKVAFMVFRSSRFPPPGMRVIKDTRVVEGRKARFRAVLFLLISALMIAASALMPYFYIKIRNTFQISDSVEVASHADSVLLHSFVPEPPPCPERS